MADNSAKEVAQGRQSYSLPDGRTVLVSPLVLRDVSTIENECLRRYKKVYMQSVMDSLDCLPENLQQKKQEEAWEKMLAFTNADLPSKEVLAYVPMANGKFKRDAAGKLVQEKRLMKYEEWWVVNQSEGRAFAMWLSARKEQPDLTLEYFENLVVQNPTDADELADIIGDLTKPTLGNDSSSVPEQAAAV